MTATALSVQLETLLAYHNLPELLQQAQAAWQDEQARRAKFLNDISPEDKWEFINGEVIMHSPALQRHIVASGNLFKLLSVFAQQHQCGSVFIEKAMVSFPRNDYEPDVIFFGVPKTALIDPDTLRFPVPDLIVEVLSPGTAAKDRGVKFADYAAHGVGEYWIVDTVAETVEIYKLDEETLTYPPTVAVGSGMLHSGVVPGFSVSVESVFDEEENMVAIGEMNPTRSLLEALAKAKTEREAAEVGRQAAEESREAAEASRQAAEAGRQAAEESRQVAEAGRQAAEAEMQRLRALLDGV